MRIELAIACTRSAQNLVSVQVIRLSARCDVSFPNGYETGKKGQPGCVTVQK